jgi:hypothetical protein
MASPLLFFRLVFMAAVGLAGPAVAQSASKGPQTSVRLPSAATVAARTLPRAEDLWEDEEPRRRAPVPAATFRTLCVRLCDGFYFPISFQTTRKGLEVDAGRCQAKCGSGAQLFFHANPGGDVASARTFTGLQYESLPNAFRHLKARVPNCGCTPEPWSTSEQERHRGYAEAERAQDAARAAVPTDPAAEDRASGADAQVEPAPVAQPPARRIDGLGSLARN